MTEDERAEINNKIHAASSELLESGQQATIPAIARLTGLGAGTVNRALYSIFRDRLDRREAGSFRTCSRCGGPITTQQSFGFEYGQPYHLSSEICAWIRLQAQNTRGRRKCGRSR